MPPEKLPNREMYEISRNPSYIDRRPRSRPGIAWERPAHKRVQCTRCLRSAHAQERSKSVHLVSSSGSFGGGRSAAALKAHLLRGQGAADRSLCMEWTPCMLEQCTRPPSLAPMHESPCFTYSHRCARLVLAGAEKWQLVVIFRRSHQLQLIGPGSSARWPIGCSLFHAEAACVSRERLVRCRPLSACAARTGRGRCLRRS